MNGKVCKHDESALSTFTHICMLEIGIGISTFGIFFIFLGILLLFDKGLIAMGNVCNGVVFFFLNIL